MPTVTLNRKVMEKLIGKKLSLDKLKDRVSYLGTDLEKIEGNEIIVEVFPNRPDMLSEQGFSRALTSFIGKKTGLKKYNVESSNEKVIVDKSVKDVRPYTACAIVKGLKFNDEKIREVIQVQEKLHVTFGRNRRKAAIGIYPFEKIKTPIKYIAKKPEEIRFKPLEHNKEINGRQILSMHPAGREYGYLLDGLKKYPVFVDANNNILSMPPIINSENVGKISEKTKDVFIECSGFDFNVLQKCLNIIVTALADMGGKIYAMQLIYGSKKFKTPNLKEEAMKVDINYVNKILGLNLNENGFKRLLARMGYGYKNKRVLIPCYRTDVLHAIDVAEDIAIAYGYENFNEEIPNVATTGKEDEFEAFKNKVAGIMTGFGLLETSSYHISNKNILEKNMLVNMDSIEMKNVQNEEYDTLRSWIIPSLLQILKENKHYEYPQNIFEIGTIFKRNNKAGTGAEENDRIATVLCHSKANYTEARQILDALLRALDLKYEVIEEDHNSFIKGRVGRVKVKGKKIAYIGEIHPKVLENFDIIMPVSAFELNLTELFKLV